jgi:hypothetical protein
LGYKLHFLLFLPGTLVIRRVASDESPFIVVSEKVEVLVKIVVEPEAFPADAALRYAPY